MFDDEFAGARGGAGEDLAHVQDGAGGVFDGADIPAGVAEILTDLSGRGAFAGAGAPTGDADALAARVGGHEDHAPVYGAGDVALLAGRRRADVPAGGHGNSRVPPSAKKGMLMSINIDVNVNVDIDIDIDINMPLSRVSPGEGSGVGAGATPPFARNTKLTVFSFPILAFFHLQLDTVLEWTATA